jgi:K+-sensing histidine kinase KdpD
VPRSIVIAIATFASFAFQVSFVVVSFIFLIVVVLQSLTGDIVSSVVVSIVGFLSELLFVPPVFSLAASDPSDTLAFLIAGLVITRLIVRAGEVANLAALQRAQTTQLYQLAQHLLASDPDVSLVEGMLRPFRFRFNLAAVCLLMPRQRHFKSTGARSNHFGRPDTHGIISGRDSQDSGTGVAGRLLRDEHKVIGATGFEGLGNVG